MIPGFSVGKTVTLNLSKLNSMSSQPAALCILFTATGWSVDPDHIPVFSGNNATWPGGGTTGPYVGWYDWATYQQDIISGLTPPMLSFA